MYGIVYQHMSTQTPDVLTDPPEMSGSGQESLNGSMESHWLLICDTHTDWSCETLLLRVRCVCVRSASSQLHNVPDVRTHTSYLGFLQFLCF